MNKMPRGYLKQKEYRVQDICDYLKKLMKEKGLSQAELGRRMNLSQSEISKMLSGRMSLKELLTILSYLDADPTKIGKLIVMGE